MVILCLGMGTNYEQLKNCDIKYNKVESYKKNTSLKEQNNFRK